MRSKNNNNKKVENINAQTAGAFHNEYIKIQMDNAPHLSAIGWVPGDLRQVLELELKRPKLREDRASS